MQNTRGRREICLVRAATFSKRSRQSCMQVSAALNRSVAWPNSRMFSKISVSECGLIHRISGVGWSNFSTEAKSLPDVAQT